jgi:uncharacterized protein YbaA (DUF1428 family)
MAGILLTRPISFFGRGYAIRACYDQFRRRATGFILQNGTLVNQHGPIPIFATAAAVPQEVGLLALSGIEGDDDPAVGTSFRFDASTEDGQWIGANAFLYGNEYELVDGASSTLISRERDKSLKRLRVGAMDPETIGIREITVVAEDGERVPWAWAAIRDKPETDALITHVAVRADRGLVNKVLFTYPVAIDRLGRQAMVRFLVDWHQVLRQA